MTGELGGLSLRDLIDQRARENPNGIFAIDPSSGQKITFHELQLDCRTVASIIQVRGVMPGESVAYALNNGANAVRTILGIMYGGFLATAINLVSGNKTIAYVLDHSDAKLVFAQESTQPILSEAVADEIPCDVVMVDEQIFQSDIPLATAGAMPEATDDGLLMYTSGTTGVPKGVVLTHRNLVAGGCNAMEAHELTQQDRGLCVLPLYHINGLCVTVLGALVSGSCVIIPHRFSVSKFWHHLRDNEGTWFSVVPTQISYLLHDTENDGTPEKINSLRFGRSASAPLSPDVHRAFEKKFDVPIIETMGLTETAAQILSNPMERGQNKIGSPGLAVGNEIIIADQQQSELPIGEEGEVLVRGPNVMRGYLKNEDATAQAITEEGWLRTGDLGRMDKNGFVYITGRLKELIIKGGENIAPREIDEALYTHPDVVEAAAFACDCSRYGQRIEAGVMLKEGSSVTESLLIDICSKKIGAFKAPDHIHFFPELPKGPSGKIQRLKLAKMAG